MQLKTDIHVNIDLHFNSDDLSNGAELARLAAVCDRLYMLIKAQRQETSSVSQETPLPQLPLPQQIAAQPQQSVSQETPAVGPAPKQPPVSERQRRRARRPLKAQPSSRHWDFEEYDRRVRAEMDRLAMDGVIPSHFRWNRERADDLPTLQAVIFRYKCSNVAELAGKLGLLPPGRARRRRRPTASTNHGGGFD